MQLGHQGAAHPVVGMALLLPRLHVLAVRVPEVRRQAPHAGVEEVGVLEHLVVEVILRRQPERARLDAHVDVFRHQHHLALRLLLLQEAHDRQDLVVVLARRQRGRQVAVDGFGLQVEPAARVLPVARLQLQALLDVFDAAAHDLVEEAARLARVARDVGEPALVGVELFERGDRQVHVVLVEAKQARRVVHQHVGIEHEKLADFGLARGTGLLGHQGGEGRGVDGGFSGIIGL